MTIFDEIIGQFHAVALADRISQRKSEAGRPFLLSSRLIESAEKP